MPAELDAELAHHAAGAVFAVDGHAQFEVLAEDGPLLGDAGRGRLTPRHHLAGLAEDPRVPDAPTRHADRLHAGVADHPEDVLHLPDVARAEDEAVRIPPHE